MRWHEFSSLSWWKPFPHGSAHVSVRRHPTFAPQAHLATRRAAEQPQHPLGAAQGHRGTATAWEAQVPLKQWWEWTRRPDRCRYTSAPGKHVETARITATFHRHRDAFRKCSVSALTGTCAYGPAESHKCSLSRWQSFGRPTCNFDSWSLITNFLHLYCVCLVAGYFMFLFSSEELKLYLGVLISNSIHKPL